MWKQPKYPSTDEWIKKMWYRYTIITQPLKRMTKMPFLGTWMDLEIIVLSKIRERHISCDITYIQYLKKIDTNELIYRTEMFSQT